MKYQEFISSKHERAENCGIETDDSSINQNAFDFQKAIVKWACRKGRAGVFAAPGLGKTLIELSWIDTLTSRGQIKNSLILCPSAVAGQIKSESEKFDIQTECNIAESHADVRSGITVTNYEKLHKFDPDKFDAVVLNESSILKGESSKTRTKLNDAFRKTRYKLSETATPAPNDHMELGTQSEFLGWMQASVMKSQFFIHDGGNTSKWRLRGHAPTDFWNWVSSWAMAITKPSDIGFSDDGYNLPELRVHERAIECESDFNNGLFHGGGNIAATDVHKEKRRSIEEKSRHVAEIVGNEEEPCVIWVETNYEDEVLKRAIPNAVVIRGSDKNKSEKLQAFTNGEIRTLITKPRIGGYGLNWQHCRKTVLFASYKFEDWYQVVRRFWRFGQTEPVDAYLLMSRNEAGIAQSLNRKQSDFEKMNAAMSLAMRDGMMLSLKGQSALSSYSPTKQVNIPEWMQCQNA